MKDVDKNIRHTWLLSLTAGLSVGAYPDKWTEEKQNIFKKAIDFHYSIAPYMYSAAMDSYTSGFPYTLTPLNIAYPKDTLAYELPNFQWMIGESILATPLLKNDMDGMMDIYLPEGIWYDYDTDEKYEGPVLLQDFKMLLNKTPCFVGGKGIVAERKKDRLNARIYPVKKNTSIIFTHLDGTDKSQITVGNVDWDNIKIVDTTIHKEISYERKGVAYIFELKRNHNYKIQ
jgi:alpha-glucosidase (family GH31 glycosyl hydrolase)